MDGDSFMLLQISMKSARIEILLRGCIMMFQPGDAPYLLSPLPYPDWGYPASPVQMESSGRKMTPHLPRTKANPGLRMAWWDSNSSTPPHKGCCRENVAALP